jgi:outer membrane protein assembly factor BamB
MFRADASHNGAYDDGGVHPTANLRWSYYTGVSYATSIDDITSSVAVANGTIYLANCTTVFALDAFNGHLKWSHMVIGDGTSISTPAVVNDIVYLATYDRHVYALDALDGHEIWSFYTGDYHTMTASPTVIDNVVYVSNAATSTIDTLWALNAKTGDVLWSSQYAEVTCSSPAVAYGILYRGTTYSLAAFDISTGLNLWNYNTWGGGQGGPVYSSPAVAYNIVYFGSDDNNFYAVNTSDGSLLWYYTMRSPVRCSPSVADGIVYVWDSDYDFYAFDALDGNIIWKKDWIATSGTMDVQQSPAVANGIVYAVDRFGYLLA